MRRSAQEAFRPAEKQDFAAWIEANVRLPEGVSSEHGAVRLWPFQREIASAIGDARIERVTVVKPVRVGFTTLLTGSLAAFVANDPSPILFVLPAEADCRDYVVSDVEPIFAATPAVARALSDDQPEGDRNTLLSRRFPGGSLKVVAAKAPRNLRRHNVRVLFLDEVDGMDETPEGSPILLAERRTMSFPDRKIVMGSTPVMEHTSHVLRAYDASDKRVFEVPCPSCGSFHELMWQHIVWDEGRPETARYQCPSCGVLHDEACKHQMVTAGRWMATAPDVVGHAGFRLNALVSLHANASWGKLAAEFVRAKGDPSTLQTFVNTILGQGWREDADEVDEAALAMRAEPWGIGSGDGLIPAEVQVVTAGVDVQHDRLEATICGWTATGGLLILGHTVIWGAYDDGATWGELRAIMGGTWPHGSGGRMGVRRVAVDAGDGATTKIVRRECSASGWVAIKGDGGNRRVIEKARSAQGGRLFIVGVDTVKSLLFRRLRQDGGVRFSDRLPPEWYEQLASERRVVRYRRGSPVVLFERVPGRRAEALDCVVYAWAAREMVGMIASMAESPPKADVASVESIRPQAWLAPRGGWLR